MPNRDELVVLAEVYFPGRDISVTDKLYFETNEWIIFERLEDGSRRGLARIPDDWVNDGDWEKVRQRLERVRQRLDED